MSLEIAEVKYKGERLEVKCSNGEIFFLPAEAASELSPASGAEISSTLEERIRSTSESFKCRQSALRLLSVRSHSEKELAGKLALRKFSSAAIAKTVSELKESSLLDDRAFAAEYARRRFEKALGIKRIALELSQRGISGELIKEAIADAELNEEREQERCLYAAEKKLQSLLAKQNAEVRLAAFLKQRGFGRQAIQKTLIRLSGRLNADKCD